MNAETMQAEIERLQTEAQQMIAEHHRMKNELVEFTAHVNSKLGELTACRRLLAEEGDA